MTVGTFLPTTAVQNTAQFVKYDGTVSNLQTELQQVVPSTTALQVVSDANASGQALVIVSESDVIPVRTGQWIGFANNSWQVYPDSQMSGNVNTQWAPYVP